MKTFDQILKKHSIDPAELAALQLEVQQEIANYVQQEGSGVPHNCVKHDPLCFRCDLSLNEVEGEGMA